MGYDYDRRASAKQVEANSPIQQVLLNAFKEGMKEKGTLDDVKAAGHFLVHVIGKASDSAFQHSFLGNAPTGTFADLSNAVTELAYAMGAAAVKPQAAGGA